MPERVVEAFPFGVARRALDDRRLQLLAEFLELFQVRADHQSRFAAVLVKDRPDHGDLRSGGRRDLVPLLGFCGRIAEPFGVGQRHPDLGALGRRDPALRLDVLPGRVIPLRSDQREHITLAAVLPDQGRGQPEAASGLQVGGHPEDRCRQQVHLVVDHQTPVVRVEDVQVLVDAAGFARHHLVRRDGDRADLLAFAGVLTDFFLGQRGAGQQFAPPLPPGDGVGDQNQCGGTGFRHRGRSDERLPGATRQHDDTRPAGPKSLDGLLLVRPQVPVRVVEFDVVRLAVDVAGLVVGGPADLEQCLLEVAAL